eukprot:6172779-Pleurochrysis_carterae.AAC.1
MAPIIRFFYQASCANVARRKGRNPVSENCCVSDVLVWREIVQRDAVSPPGEIVQQDAISPPGNYRCEERQLTLRSTSTSSEPLPVKVAAQYWPIAQFSLLVAFVYGVNDIDADVMCEEGDILLDWGHSEVHLGDDVSAERGLFLAASSARSFVLYLRLGSLKGGWCSWLTQWTVFKSTDSMGVVLVLNGLPGNLLNDLRSYCLRSTVHGAISVGCTHE